MKHPNDSTKGGQTEALSPLFSPGRVVMTHGVEDLIRMERLDLKEVCAMLARHLSGDWGELGCHDRRQNEEALRDGSRLLSAYRSLGGAKLWVITEAMGEGDHRASTTVLLPEEY